jgi:hypothetical protein
MLYFLVNVARLIECARILRKLMLRAGGEYVSYTRSHTAKYSTFLEFDVAVLVRLGSERTANLLEV